MTCIIQVPAQIMPLFKFQTLSLRNTSMWFCNITISHASTACDILGEVFKLLSISCETFTCPTHHTEAGVTSAGPGVLTGHSWSEGRWRYLKQRGTEVKVEGRQRWAGRGFWVGHGVCRGPEAGKNRAFSRTWNQSLAGHINDFELYPQINRK